MSVRTSIDPLESIKNGGDVISYLLDSDGMNHGSYVEVPNGIQRDRGRNDWYEAHLVDNTGSGVIRYIELERSEGTPSFSDLKQHLKRHGSPIDELFTVVAYRNGEDPLTSPVDDNLTFLFIDEQFSSEDVEVTFDLKYFTVKRSGVEPAYVDFLEDLSVNSGQGRTSLERDVEGVFSIREITQSFYEEFGEIFRGTLQDAIHNLEDPDEHLNAYTRTVVNRVLFLMFIEEKGWLDGDVDYIENQYEAAKEDPNKHLYHDLFEPLFFEALSNTNTIEDGFLGRIPFLNGGLFERGEIETDVTIDEAFFDSLLDPDENEDGEPKGFLRRYKISLRESNPSEQELVVDPEFIGRIFEMFMQEDERSEVGAFYTPKPITAYMTKNALKQHLLERTDLANEQVVSLVSDHTAPESLTDEQADAVDDALRSATVLDPAVGSGAFIIAMLEELVAVAEAVDKTRDGTGVTDRFERKEEFIADNLYGVDIDAGGIELCKFRVWLHLMQDLDVSHEEFLERNDELALPNLGFKFFVGNSLVGEHDPTRVDVGSYQETLTGGLESTLNEIHETRSEFLTAHGDEKEDLGERLEDLTDQLETQLAVKGGKDWMNDVAEEAGSTFAWTSMIPEVILDGGFDIVIGNPPYEGQSKQDYIKALSHHYEEKYDFYKTIPRMRHDLYQKFVIRAWELADDGGVVSYITSNTFLTLSSKQTTRRILQSNQLHDLILANPDTFDATVNPAIFSFSKQSDTPDDYHLQYVDATSTAISEYRSFIDPEVDQDNNQTVGKILYGGETRGYWVPIGIYRNSIRQNFFEPTEANLRLYEKFVRDVSEIHREWEGVIQDSTNIEKNLDRIQDQHHSNLKPGDVSILGLLTTSGVGLQTGDNEEYLAYLDGTREAEKVKERNSDFEYIAKNENSFSWMSRVITPDQVANTNSLTQKEKQDGINGDDDDAVWVPLEKGFVKDDLYFKTDVEYINWSEDSLQKLRDSNKAYLRNMDYNFSEGVCLSIGKFGDLFARYTNNRVIEHKCTILSPTNENLVTSKYLTGILNSRVVVHLTENLINRISIEASDVRIIPIPIPTESEISKISSLVEKAIAVQKGESKASIKEIQKEIDETAAKIYDVDLSDIEGIDE